MGYSAKEILDDIRRNELNHLKTVKNKMEQPTKEDLKLIEADKKLSEKQYLAAKGWHSLIVKVFNVPQEKSRFYSLTEDKTEDSDALQDLVESTARFTEANDYFSPEEKGNKMQMLSYVQTKTGVVHASELLKGLEQDTERHTAWLRTLNHYAARASGIDLTKNYPDIEILSKTYKNELDNIKGIFKNSVANYYNNQLPSHLEQFVVEPTLVNAVVGLINKYLPIGADEAASFTDEEGNPIFPGGVPCKVAKLPVKKDKLTAEGQQIEQDAKGAESKLGNLFQTFLQGGIGAVAMELAISALSKIIESKQPVPKHLREASTANLSDPFVLKMLGVIDPDNALVDFGDIQTLETAEAYDAWCSTARGKLKPEVVKYTSKFKPQSMRDKDLEDVNVIKAVPNANGLREMLASKTAPQNAMALFNTISRRMFIKSNGKSTLSDWDEKANDVLYEHVEWFNDFIALDNDNRSDDEDDLDDYHEALEEVQGKIFAVKKVAEFLPYFYELEDVKNHFNSESNNILSELQEQADEDVTLSQSTIWGLVTLIKDPTYREMLVEAVEGKPEEKNDQNEEQPQPEKPRNMFPKKSTKNTNVVKGKNVALVSHTDQNGNTNTLTKKESISEISSLVQSKIH